MANEATGQHGASHPEQTQGSQPGAQRSDAQEIDVQRLADKVYGLMLAEIRLSSARGVRTLWGGMR